MTAKVQMKHKVTLYVTALRILLLVTVCYMCPLFHSNLIIF